MARWFRSYWDEEDRWFYFEVGDDGWVSRQVELEGPALRPVEAASAGEDDVRYGFTAESPVTGWEGHVEEPLALREFEDVWATARRYLAALEA
ncbi:hypothetical protein [Streptomyces sp. L-9-10]|uniref:hypothetical protein n=1 Tax=Streptomyces sp. L-9-10 TaxID=1478131 RepID=UPI00101DF385|nr:hypothetical protein [Streptomyces sp. L-9-10]